MVIALASRAERAAEAQRLRADGLKIREIGERMGASTSTVSDWLHDPDSSRLKARKDFYRGFCQRCGAQTDGSNGRGRAPLVCAERLRVWDRESIIAAIQAWATSHGGYPPKRQQWDRRGPNHPSRGTVDQHFGAWAVAIRAAGFRPGSDHRPETTDWIIAEIRSGVPTAMIAGHLGVTTSAIHMRLNHRGLRVRALREQAGA
jgi:hypothetical protein